MRLDRVEIEDFRGIDRLSVGLDELTTVIGEPDAGKSSLLRAIARVLAPGDVETLPRFVNADFHRPAGPDSARASELSITLGLRDAGDDGLVDGGVSLRVVAQRADDAGPTTTVTLVDRSGAAVEGVHGPGFLAEVRRRHPAVIVGGPRAAISGAARDREHRDSRLRTALLGAAEPRSPLTWDELVDVRDDLMRAAGALAAQIGPAPERKRSAREMTDTPRPLVTDLGDALDRDAGDRRRIAALWLLVSILDALPPEGIGLEAEPILLFDDIEANLHPTWLAALSSVALNLPFQQVVATHSPEVLAWVPLGSLRRLVRVADGIETRSVQSAGFSTDELRRLTYHVRLNRGGAFFARCWVLVEGETEAWLIPEFARLAGVEFPVEGIRVLEVAQAGLTPILKMADDLGIGWVLFVDGDQAGQNYARAARKHLEAGGAGEVVVLPARDIENYLFETGYDDVIRLAAGRSRKRKPGEIIHAAIERTSKPSLALEILAAADERGSAGVPPVIRELAVKALELARR